MLEIKKFVFGPFTENTYLIFETESMEAIVVDPGNAEPFEDNLIAEFIDKEKLILKNVIATHSHIDHILGVRFLTDKYKVPFISPEKDIPLLKNFEQQGMMFGIKTSIPPDPAEFIHEGKEINLSNAKGRFIYTPGHTPGEYCLFFEKEEILFSGDVLFRESIGRTDLWGGDYPTIIDSIKSKLLILPETVRVFPGHGEETTIGYEKNHNPFLNT